MRIVGRLSGGADLVDLEAGVQHLPGPVSYTHLPKQLTVAVMGCAVNGPGEAREADVGIACGDGVGLLFKKGEIVCKVPEGEILPTLLRFIEEL